jgi:hypothetical protein
MKAKIAQLHNILTSLIAEVISQETVDHCRRITLRFLLSWLVPPPQARAILLCAAADYQQLRQPWMATDCRMRIIRQDIDIGAPVDTQLLGDVFLASLAALDHPRIRACVQISTAAFNDTPVPQYIAALSDLSLCVLQGDWARVPQIVRSRVRTMRPAVTGNLSDETAQQYSKLQTVSDSLLRHSCGSPMA